MNTTAARFWDWTPKELDRFLGIGKDNPVSFYLAGKDFSPDILSMVQPKQLVNTETHDGVIPVNMGEDGKHVLARSVEKMLGGIPRRIFVQAEQHIQQLRPELVSTYRTYCRMKAMPFMTMEHIAQTLGLADDSALYRRLNAFRSGVNAYLHYVAIGWPEGSDVYEGLQTRSEQRTEVSA